MKGYNVSLISMDRGSIGLPLRGSASGCVASGGQAVPPALPQPGHGLKAARGTAGAGPVQGAGAAGRRLAAAGRARGCSRHMHGRRFAAMLPLSIAADKILYGR